MKPVPLAMEHEPWPTRRGMAAGLEGCGRGGGNLLWRVILLFGMAVGRGSICIFLWRWARYMLGVRFLNIIPESMALAGRDSALFVLCGYFSWSPFEHTPAHFISGEVDTHGRDVNHHRVRRSRELRG